MLQTRAKIGIYMPKTLNVTTILPIPTKVKKVMKHNE